jgi:phosphotriesterase-related protein
MTDEDRTAMSRREALRFLGGGAAALAGMGLLSTRGAVAAWSGPAQQSPIIRTLGGDLAPSAAPDGAILVHEHLHMRFPIGSEASFSDDVDLMIREVRIARDEGVGVIVDGGHPDMARDLSALQRIDAESGVRVVASGGYYMQRTYPPELAGKSAEQIGEELSAEAALDRLGAFGEIGQQGGVMTDDERKVHRAIALAHVRTGLPVFTHNAYSIRATNVPRDAALRQLEIYEAAGANLANICIGHVCCLDDPAADIAIQIARRGAYVGFDRVTLNGTMPDTQRVVMAKALIDAGHADKLLLSSDFFAANTLKVNGGNGIAQTVTVFAPMLRAAGVSEAVVRSILVDNPRRFLSFTPRA